jgi:hypothetical protein
MGLKTKIKYYLDSDSFLILIICFITLFFSLLKLSKGYSFEWDQSDDATKVFSIITQKKPLLIGPRVSNDNGFFVGPYHYYYLLPFYLFTKGDPVAGSYALIFVNILTTLISFILIKKITNRKIAFISSLLISVCLGKTCWSAMYASLISIITFYICYQAINKRFYFPLAMLFAGFISNIHLVPISLIPIILISFVLSKNKPKLNDIIFGIILFIIPFIPLIVFDLRHDFLNSRKIILLITGQNGSEIINIQNLYLRSFWRSLNIFNIFDQNIERFLILLLIMIFPFFIKNIKNRILVIVWILFPLILLSQYHGAISEYYYSMITALIPLLISIVLTKLIKNNYLLYLIVFLFLFFMASKIHFRDKEITSLNDKKAIVEYLTNQKQDQPFNLSYETGIGFNFGFDYLFEYYQNKPKNIDQAHLYTLFLNNTVPNNSNVVFRQNIYQLVRR